MESRPKTVQVKFAYSSVAFVAIVSLTFIIIHGPQETQTLSLSQTFSVLQIHREIVWNFHAITCTNLLLGSSLLVNVISGTPIMLNSSVDPNFAEIAWQGDTTEGDNETNSSSASSSFEDSAEPTSICASSTSCKPSPPSPKNETRIVRKMKSEKERLRLELLKQIKSLDHMKCFPKVLCGLSVDSSKTSTGIDSHLVRSYIQLMRTAKPEDDSSEESKPSIDNTKNALSLFLMKSGILPTNKKLRKDASISASSSEEDDDPLSFEDQQTPYKSSIERKNEQLKEFLKLSKRKLAISDDDADGLDSLDSFISRNLTYKNPQGLSHHKDFRPLLFMPSENTKSGGGEGETSSITGQIGSIVSSWVPWLSLSFGADSFEKDPFFTGGKNKNIPGTGEQEQSDAWKKDLDKLTYIMKLKKEIERKQAKLRRRKQGRRNDDESDDEEEEQFEVDDYITGGRLSRDLKASTDSEMVIYSTAVEIGKKLKDPRQCDYLYNGCPVPYSDILTIISSIRKDIKEEKETAETLSKEMEDYLPSRKKLIERLKASNALVANLKTKTQSKPTRNKAHQKKQQNTQPKKQSPQHSQHQQQSPITKISHTLPNGEKVEINVQLSGKVEGYATHGEEFDTEVQADTEAEAEIGETEYVFDDESAIEDNEDTLHQNPQDPNLSSEPEEAAISASYELDDEKQDGDDFRKPTPLEIFNKISLKGAQEQITSPTPKQKYSVTRRPRPTTRQPTGSTKRPKPKPKPTASPSAVTTEKRPTWSKGTTKRPSTVKPANAKPTPRVTPPVNKLKPLMQSHKPSSSIEDDESSMESTITKPTSKRPLKPSTLKPVVTPIKTISSNKRHNKTTSRPSKRSTTPRPTSVSESSSKNSVPLKKRPATKRPTSTSKPKVTTSRYYKVSKTHPPTGETNTSTNTSSLPSKTNTKAKISSSSSKKSSSSPAPSKAMSKSPHSKRKPDKQAPRTTPMTTTTNSQSTSTLSPLAMFTKSVMEDVIEEFYHKKHIPYAIPPQSPPPPTGETLNVKKKHLQKNGSNGIMESDLVQIGTEGTSTTPEPLDDETFISIETDASGEIKLHSGNKKEQLGSSSGGVAAGATGKASESNSNDAISKPNSGESSPESLASGKKRIKYKNPKLPYLVILNSSTLDHPNPLVLSEESGVAIGSGNRRPSSQSSGGKGYTISHRKPTNSKPSTNPIDLPPYVFQEFPVQSTLTEYPYWVPPSSSMD